MKAATWSRDSHGLFDYEDLHVERKTFVTHMIRFLVRKSNGEMAMIEEAEIPKFVAEKAAVLFKVMPSTNSAGTTFH